MPIFSLPSDFGIGTLGRDACDFIDFLAAADVHVWEIMPICHTDSSFSPHNALCARAGNPLLIDLQPFVDQGVFSSRELSRMDWGRDRAKISYSKVAAAKYKALEMVFDALGSLPDSSFDRFREDNQDWLEDYALFMALKEKFGGRSWQEWPEKLRLRRPGALEKARKELAKETEFWKGVQYLFFRQWHALKKRANEKGISIIGDLPIYVSGDSADVWANPDQFQLDEKGRPTEVAGCPPDGFSEDGQLWGNPLFDWERMKEENYAWWMRRIAFQFQIYDVLRIDHFRGFDAFYAIPYGDKTARNGRWRPGPGIEFFQTVKKTLGKKEIIAEDLGFITPEVRKLQQDSGYPGMKVLEFAFDSREESDYMPHLYPVDSVCYTGTHDNVTLKQWFDEAAPEDVACAKTYLGLNREEGYIRGMIRGCMGSVSRLCVVQMQDYLELGKEARMNFPGTLSSANWTWRAEKGFDSDALAARIYAATKLYGRVGK